MVVWSENVFFKGNHGYKNFAMEIFLGGEHFTGSSTKTA